VWGRLIEQALTLVGFIVDCQRRRGDPDWAARIDDHIDAPN
jgi:hypothetical protein